VWRLAGEERAAAPDADGCLESSEERGDDDELDVVADVPAFSPCGRVGLRLGATRARSGWRP
jgi:hypothetical protein